MIRHQSGGRPELTGEWSHQLQLILHLRGTSKWTLTTNSTTSLVIPWSSKKLVSPWSVVTICSLLGIFFGNIACKSLVDKPILDSWEGLIVWSAGTVIGFKTTGGHFSEALSAWDILFDLQRSSMFASAVKSSAFSGIVKLAHTFFNTSVAAVETAGDVYFNQASRRSWSFFKPDSRSTIVTRYKYFCW